MGRVKEKGFTIVELLIGLTIGIIVIGAGITLVIGQGSSTDWVKEQNKIEDSMRVAGKVLGASLNQAGYFGCQNRGGLITNQIGGTKNFQNNFEQYIYGFEGSEVTSFSPTFSSSTVIGVPITGNGAPKPATTATAKDGSDILVIRGSGPIIYNLISAANQTGNLTLSKNSKIKNGSYLAISNCTKTIMFQNTEVGNCTMTGNCVISHGTSGASPGNITNDFGEGFGLESEIVPLRTEVYYVATSFKCQNNGNCSEKSLWRSDTNINEEIVDGVERMNVNYIIDKNASGVGSLLQRADEVNGSGLWGDVLGVEVELLMKSEKEMTRTAESYSFNKQTITPSDRFLRKVIKVTAMIRNSGK